MKPTTGLRSRSSLETPGGGLKWKCWRREVKNWKSSILAKLSPIQTLRPENKNKQRINKKHLQLHNKWWIWSLPHLQRRAWRHPFWQTCPGCLGSVLGWSCQEFPTHFHPSIQIPVVATHWYPVQKKKKKINDSWCKHIIKTLHALTGPRPSWWSIHWGERHRWFDGGDLWVVHLQISGFHGSQHQYMVSSSCLPPWADVHRSLGQSLLEPQLRNSQDHNMSIYNIITIWLRLTLCMVYN